jgi:hypothetical protein
LSAVPFSKNTCVWCDASGCLSVIAKEGQNLAAITSDLSWLGNVIPMVSASGDGSSFIALLQNNPDDSKQKTLVAANVALLSANTEGLEVVARIRSGLSGCG